MAAQTTKVESIDGDVGPVIIRVNEITLRTDTGGKPIVNGITIQIDENGKPTLKTSGDVTVITNGDITTYTKGTVHQKEPESGLTSDATNTFNKRNHYTIGDVLPDGWVVGPASSETGMVMAIEPTHVALHGYRTWYEGEKHAAELRNRGNLNARQPSSSELTDIYNFVVKAGRNDKADFNTSASSPHGRYWTTSLNQSSRGGMRVHYLSDGHKDCGYLNTPSVRVRCVRDEPGLTVVY